MEGQIGTKHQQILKQKSTKQIQPSNQPHQRKGSHKTPKSGLQDKAVD